MSEPKDFKDTVFLPTTDFPMRAGLPQKEPTILAKWQADDQYRQLREARKDAATQFILDDGPPYANGDIHVGHALNHILKDMVCRTQSLLGKDAPYVPGWDCHGLPIEWKVEEQYRKKKRNKDEVPVKEFRAECRAYAQNWVNVQREQLKRLGVLGDWDNPYLTMDFQAESTIVAELLKFAESGQLYRGAKPVMWSPVEKTALAEAEVEYEDITSTQIDVAFEIVESPIAELVGAHAVIWTTTPWTIPVNQAIAYGPDVEYVHIRLTGGMQTSGTAGDWGQLLFGRGVVVAKKLFADLFSRMYISGTTIDVLWQGKGSDLAGTIARHPMHHLGGFYANPRPFLPGDFVTTDSGTGLVHMSPDHGEEDFDLCTAHGINPVFAVEGDGRYRDDWAWLGAADERRGSVINPKFNAPDGPICSDLREAGALLAASADYKHSYPHSWRSKAKVIYRCTPQWFVPMDKPIEGRDATLRQTAVQAIADTRWVPEKGRNRIGAMAEGRPDWVLSRQRAWGVPITLFVNRKTGEYLNDPAVNARIIAAAAAEGVDAWDDERAQDYLGAEYDAADYERVTDILDVWFDSGCTHVFTLESGRWPDLVRRDGGTHSADLYLEGSDQHRGWFQSSLLQSCATRGQAPYKAVLTHGFTMDQKGLKMSKSMGNTVDPLKVMETYGADIVRLWALSVDYTEDHRIGDEILKGVSDQYRKLRNTFRYLLGALGGFSDDEKVAVEAMPELERYVLHLLAELDAKLRVCVDDFDFNTYTRLLSEFCNEDLSAFFFDIRKDTLYCEVNPASGYQTHKRRAYRTVLDVLFHALVRYAAPVLVFTSEEVWTSRFGADAGSVHLAEWPELQPVDINNNRWELLRYLRGVVNETIEPLRRSKEVGSGLAASVELFAINGAEERLEGLDLQELFMTANCELRVKSDDEGIATHAVAEPTTHHKCGRCWRHLPEVTTDGDLCNRCDTVLNDGKES